MSEYISIAQYCEKYGLDGGNVRRLAAAGRINAIKIGVQWVIPADEPRPADARVKSGKYKNWRKPKQPEPD
jgi:hypothetical protein